MSKYFLIIIFFCINNSTLFSQVVVNEIINHSKGFLMVELYNNSSYIIKIKSIIVRSKGIEVRKSFKDFEIQPAKLSLFEFELNNGPSDFNKVNISITTEDDHFDTNFNGYILKGESAGRYPDVEGEFIIYSTPHISPGMENSFPGMLVKKTSKTKFSPRDSSPNAALYYNNNYWIFGGWDYNYESETYSSKSNVWRSGDGLEWVLVNENPPFSHYSSYFVFNNQMMVYEDDSVFISQDGITWGKQPLNSDLCFQSRFTVFKNKAYAFNSNMIGESTDGINWIFSQTDISTDASRYLPAFVSSEDRLWLYGGSGFNDVWTSTDGLHWEKLLDYAPWAKRHWFNYTYFDNKIWMIDGNLDENIDNNDFGNLRDFWYSSDGIKWNRLVIDKSYSNRHASFLWNDGENVLISSGFGNNSPDRLYNDVWELTVETLNTTPNQHINAGPDIIADNSRNLKELNEDLSDKVIYPNPNRGVIKISKIGSFTMKIFDIAGRPIMNKIYPHYYHEFEEDLSNVLKTNGIYIIVLTDNKTGQTFSQKLDVVH